MKKLLVIALSMAVLGLAACKDEPKISGEPVSHWVEQIEDLSSNSVTEAVSNLNLADKADLQPYRDDLRKLAKNGKGMSGHAAAGILYRKFREAVPSRASVCVEDYETEAGARNALYACYEEDPVETIQSLRISRQRIADVVEEMLPHESQYVELKRQVELIPKIIRDLEEQ